MQSIYSAFLSIPADIPNRLLNFKSNKLMSSILYFLEKSNLNTLWLVLRKFKVSLCDHSGSKNFNKGFIRKNVNLMTLEIINY